MLLHSSVQYVISKHKHTALSHEQNLSHRSLAGVLSRGQQNDLKATFLINVSHQIKRALRLLTNKKIQKRVLVPLTQKWLLPLHQTNSEQDQSEREPLELSMLHFLLRLSHRNVARTKHRRLHSRHRDMNDSRCIRVVLKHL